MRKVGCWLVRMEWRPAGLSVCLPLLISPITINSRRKFLLAPAHLGGPGKRAVNGCACQCACDAPSKSLLRLSRAYWWIACFNSYSMSSSVWYTCTHTHSCIGLVTYAVRPDMCILVSELMWFFFVWHLLIIIWLLKTHLYYNIVWQFTLQSRGKEG